MRSLEKIALCLVALVQSGCVAAAAAKPDRPAMTEAAYPGELIDSAALPDGLFLRQRVEAHYPGGSASFAAVLQTADGVLSLVGLTPYGARAFLIEQRGQTIRYTQYVAHELPFPPRFILLDVHRALFRALPNAPLADGLHSGEDRGEALTEQWAQGHLVVRTYRRLNGHPVDLITVRYGAPAAATRWPDLIELDNAWFGYRLTIRNLP